jgi:hypothetical protein
MRLFRKKAKLVSVFMTILIRLIAVPFYPIYLLGYTDVFSFTR